MKFVFRIHFSLSTGDKFQSFLPRKFLLGTKPWNSDYWRNKLSIFELNITYHSFFVGSLMLLIRSMSDFFLSWNISRVPYLSNLSSYLNLTVFDFSRHWRSSTEICCGYFAQSHTAGSGIRSAPFTRRQSCRRCWIFWLAAKVVT